MTTIDPNQLFGTLMANARPQKQRNLKIIHEVCAQLHRLGSKDFSLATVGRMSSERGGMAAGTLYNSTAADSKALIRAWSDFANDKSSELKQSRETLRSDYALLQKISDPALRALLGSIIAERDKLRGEVKVLKASTNIVIDNRTLPGKVSFTPAGQVVQVLDEKARLSETEIQALSRAISPDFLDEEGWSVGPYGEILNARGRKVFDIGFANAIKKILTDDFL